ncbi:MAG: hypothetical protein QE279_10135 [Rhodoferax sp.]|nr:hypothetical protein [Rhodoferax sp.]
MASFRTLCQQGIRPLGLPDASQVETVSVDINWPDAGAGIAVNDVVQLCDIPAGFEVVFWKLVSEDIDSNASPTVAFSFGVLNAGKTAIGGGAADNWSGAGGITVGQAGGAVAANTVGANGVNCLSSGRAATRSLGLVATAATATAALAGKRATLLLDLRSGAY